MKTLKHDYPILGSDQNPRQASLVETSAEPLRFRFEACRPDPTRRRIGWLCSYTPEELIIAAGFVPYRFSGDVRGVPDNMDLLPANLCPYVRKILDTALAGLYRDLAGIVFVSSCDAMRRLADIWTAYATPGFYHCLDVPRRSDMPAENFLIEQLREFKSFLVRQAGRDIRDEDIFRAIETANYTRALMHRLSRLRRHTFPAISGSLYHAIALCAMQADKQRFNIEAQRFLDILESMTVDRPQKAGVLKPRVLLSGCVVSGSDLLQFIEACGCTIVADDLCTGMRHYNGLVNAAMDPLRAIARRYLRRPACARMTGAGARIRRILDMAREYRADGVIFYTLKFCDLVQSDLPRLYEALQQEGFPLLHIELENFGSVSGQTQTRVEAFIELLLKRE